MEISRFIRDLVEVYGDTIICVEENLIKDNIRYAMIYSKKYSVTILVEQSTDIETIKQYDEMSNEDIITRANSFKRLLESLDLLALKAEDFVKRSKEMKFINIETSRIYKLLQPSIHYCKSLDEFCIVLKDANSNKTILPIKDLYKDSIEDGELVPTYEILFEE